MTMHSPVITLDGPSGVGKGTLCRALADALQWHSLDSGAIYRVLALAAIHHDVNKKSEEALALLASHLDVNFLPAETEMKISLEGEDVTSDIRTEKMGNLASEIAAFPGVREALLRRQRAFRQTPGLIADGRDMGTLVFPDAEIKIFLDALPEERAQRRMKQLQKKSINVSFEKLLIEIKARDLRDRNRKVAPLIPAQDALVLDTTFMDISQVTETALNYVSKKFCLRKKTIH